jgi:hypothetical protein
MVQSTGTLDKMVRFCWYTLAPLLLLSLLLPPNVEGFSLSGGKVFSRRMLATSCSDAAFHRGWQRPHLSRRAATSPLDDDEAVATSIRSSGWEDSEEPSESHVGSVDTDTPTMKTLDKEVGGYDPFERIGGREILVGDPQSKVQEQERSVTSILKQLASIQQQGPQKYCILGTRHCSFLHQQIIELL